jgi:hypothetical protein
LISGGAYLRSGTGVIATERDGQDAVPGRASSWEG